MQGLWLKAQIASSIRPSLTSISRSALFSPLRSSSLSSSITQQPIHQSTLYRIPIRCASTTRSQLSQRLYSTSNNTKVMASAEALLDAAKHRHSHYVLTKKSPIPDSKIREIVETTILEVPSAFNTQSTRVLLLFHKEHDHLWDIVTELLRPHVKDPEKWKNGTEKRMQGFKGAYATVMHSLFSFPSTGPRATVPSLR